MSETPRFKLLFTEDDVLPPNVVRMHHPVYGGDVVSLDGSVRLPFVLRKEAVELTGDGLLARIVEGAVERVKPRCVHFGACGGCQYQMQAESAQLTDKRNILRGLLYAQAIDVPDDIPAHAGEPYEYRNRIRLRVEHVGSQLRFGYSVRGTTEFLPIVMCPIASPLLWASAEAVLQSVSGDRDAAFWLSAASEVELFTNDDLAGLQITLLCAPRTKAAQGSLQRCFNAWQQAAPAIISLTAIASDPRTGPTGRVLDTVGAAGLNYRVRDETYWISRGSFFQVNRFLLDKLVSLVCEEDGKPRAGALAWDLYAGVGLFSRVLARSFAQVIAVEANSTAAADNRAGLAKLSAAHQCITATTLDFLERAVLQRERPELIVLDPPRAGAGVDACELLLRLRPREIVYVSCDPTTLARDLAVLQRGYRIEAMHLVDLFPQTFHMETIVVLRAGE